MKVIYDMSDKDPKFQVFDISALSDAEKLELGRTLLFLSNSKEAEITLRVLELLELSSGKKKFNLIHEIC